MKCPHCKKEVFIKSVPDVEEYYLTKDEFELDKDGHRICNKYDHEHLRTPKCVTECSHLNRDAGDCVHPDHWW